ncbi:MAG: Na+/H+ antiporter NhaA, partial [Bacteroidales bacterium]
MVRKITKATLHSPIQKFIKAESFSGFLLFFTTILALVMANSPLREIYHHIINFDIGLRFQNDEFYKPLIFWVNDGLMAVFFFLIGLEIKREMIVGEINTVKKAALPIFAAVGGMLCPMILYLCLNNNPETMQGWGIPMATDIAFSLAILQILGKRVPIGLKVFLTAFAIIDDIGAVAIIALFYTENIVWSLLLYAFILLGMLYFLSYRNKFSKYILVPIGITVWILFLQAGIHPTLAGILLAFSVPIRQKIDEFTYAEKLKQIVNKITLPSNTNEHPVLTNEQIEEIDNLEDWTSKVQSPLQHMEHKLHYWVAYFIIPIFAFANAGVTFTNSADINFYLAVSILLALFAGKTIGVFLFSLLSIKFKIAALPENVNFTHLLGIAILSGVGFTMSLFIANLAFADSLLYLNSAKFGIIMGSVISGTIGLIVLK